MNPLRLMERDDFRTCVFARDGWKCVLCGWNKSPDGLDAHHLYERRLYPDGGYYLDNGVTVCAECHLKAEQTRVSPGELAMAAAITGRVLPPHLDPESDYDKWGNPVLSNGTRLRGEMFFDEPVQKMLAWCLDLFTDKVKYPRTFHLPWSPGLGEGDRVLPSLDGLRAAGEVVVTAKMDGENTSLYRTGMHERSIDYAAHPSRNRLKALHATIAHDIPEGWRVCGENLFARHAIHYHRLPAHFLVFSVWNERNECLGWDETVEWASLLGFKTVPVLYRGPFDEAVLKKLHRPELAGDPCEGYVVRPAARFTYGEFRAKVGKYVRANHVQTSRHWLHGQPMVPNEVEPCG